MLKIWRERYAELTRFIASHPEIKIEKSVVRIPESVRSEFYQIFRAAGETFVREYNQALLNQAEVLSENYIKAEEDITKLLGIEGITNYVPVNRFLHKPIDQFVSGLYHPLFDLLKEQIDIETYEKRAAVSIDTAFSTYSQLGYEIWLVLSIIKLLEADRTYQVEAAEFNEEELFKHGGPIETPVPDPEEANGITFTHPPEVGYIVPDQTVHSVRLGQYFSFRPEIIEALGTATNKSVLREWLSVSDIVELEPNVIVVYADKQLKELSIIADTVSFCRPDLIIECVGLNKEYNEDSVLRVQTYHKLYKPRLGTYIVSMGQLAEPKPEDSEVGIYYLHVGFDQSKIENIMELFIDKEGDGE
ncbi:hypothetical protein ACFLYB_06835 [Chloroflexota bacterium]